MASYKDYYNGIMPPKPPKAGNQSSGNMDWMKKYMPAAPPLAPIAQPVQQPSRQSPAISRWRSSAIPRQQQYNPFAMLMQSLGGMPGYGYPTPPPAQGPSATGSAAVGGSDFNPFLRPAQAPANQGPRPWGMDNPFASAAGMPPQQQLRLAAPMGNPYLPRMS